MDLALFRSFENQTMLPDLRWRLRVVHVRCQHVQILGDRRQESRLLQLDPRAHTLRQYGAWSRTLRLK